MAEERREKAERARQDAEELRIGAEREREDHEIRRRVAEGGPDQHVPREIGEVSPPGRWERDIERGVADEEREQAVSTVYSRVTKLYALRVTAIMFIPLLIICWLLWRNDQRLDDEVHNRCVDGMVNRNAIRDSLLDGLASLGYGYQRETNTIIKTGSPIDYYQTHPQELQQALARAQAALKRFPPIEC